MNKPHVARFEATATYRRAELLTIENLFSSGVVSLVLAIIVCVALIRM